MKNESGTHKDLMAVVLAAGKSTRMKSRYSKLVHRILGRELINIVLDNLTAAGIAEEQIVVVVGPESQEIKKMISRAVKYAVQEKALGTAHALLSAREHIEDFSGHLLVSVGDNPYVTPAELKNLYNLHQNSRSLCTLISAVFPDQPPRYGRIIRDHEGQVLDVVEELDASPEQIKIREVNSSIYLFDNQRVLPLLSLINNQNVKNEYYLTDIVKIVNARGYVCQAVVAGDYHISLGINDRWDLAQAQENLNQRRLRELACQNGVTILQPETVTVEYDVEIGNDTIIYPNTYIAAGTKIGENCRIGPNVFLDGAKIPAHKMIHPAKYRSGGS